MYRPNRDELHVDASTWAMPGYDDEGNWIGGEPAGEPSGEPAEEPGEVARWHIEQQKRWEDPDADPWWIDLGSLPRDMRVGPFDDRIEAVKAFRRLAREGKVVRLVFVTRRVVKQVNTI